MSSTGTAGLDGLIVPRPAEREARPEPTWETTVVVAHELIGGRYHRLVLHSPEIAATANAGQFVMVSVPESTGARILLPRPMAIHRRRVDEGLIELIYNVVGRGTAALSDVETGDRMLVTGPLGRGFELETGVRSALLLGRGIGVCAVMGVAEDAQKSGVNVTAVLSANTRASIIGVRDCDELGAQSIAVCEEDGTSSLAALAARLRQQLAENPPDVIMVCGSNRLTLLAAELAGEWGAEVQVSLEAHMACGLGYCHGCAAPVESAETEEGPLVCVDGPVFDVVVDSNRTVEAA